MRQQGLIVSTGPHVHSGESVQKMNFTFIIALLPAIGTGLYVFGVSALQVLVLAVVSAVAFEAGLQKLMGREITLRDNSAILTGILLALILSPTVPWWAVLTGTFAGLLIGKHIYGGLGSNPFHPVLVGWATIKLSYPSQLDMSISVPGVVKLEGLEALAQDYAYFAEAYGIESWETIGAKMKLFLKLLWRWEYIPGMDEMVANIGGMSAIALLIGALFLLWRRYISWHIPIGFLVPVFVFSAIFGNKEYLYPFVLIQLLGGGTLLAAFFIATDPVTTPMTSHGMFVFGILCGFITMVGILWGSWIEPVWFAILVGNAFTPLIDKLFKPRPFGRVRSA